MLPSLNVHHLRRRSSDLPGTATRGATLVAVGGAVATLAFVAVPFLSLPIVGGVTMPTAIVFLEEPALVAGTLWAMPVATALVALTGLRLRFGWERGAHWCRSASTGTVALCGLVLAGLLAALFLPAAAMSAGSAWMGDRFMLGSAQVGYYLCIVGVAAALLGAASVAGRVRVAEPS